MSDQQPLKLLLVDDEVDILEPLSFNLESCGYGVVTATSGHEAFETFQKDHFDAIVTDIKMPNGNGVGLLKNIKTHTPLCPVVGFITGYSDLTLREAYALGAGSTFPKPFDFSVLKEKIEWSITPMEKRWAQPPDSKEVVQIKTSDNRDLGSGGVSLPIDGEVYNQIAVDQLVEIQFASTVGPVQGMAWLRWIEADEGLVGVEFAYLAEVCRAKVIDFINESKPVPYIPKN